MSSINSTVARLVSEILNHHNNQALSELNDILEENNYEKIHKCTLYYAYAQVKIRDVIVFDRIFNSKLESSGFVRFLNIQCDADREVNYYDYNLKDILYRIYDHYCYVSSHENTQEEMNSWLSNYINLNPELDFKFNKELNRYLMEK